MQKQFLYSRHGPLIFYYISWIWSSRYYSQCCDPPPHLKKSGMHTIRRIELLALQITGVKYKFQLNISVYVVNYSQDNNYLLPIGTDYLMLPIGFVDNPSMRGSLLFAFIIKLDLFPYEISFQ